MASNGYARITGSNNGIALVDINPTKLALDLPAPYFGWVQMNSKVYSETVPCFGYDKFAVWGSQSGQQYKFYYADGTYGAEVAIPNGSWSNYVDIPSNAVAILFSSTYTIGSGIVTAFSMLTKESPYNPDNV